MKEKKGFNVQLFDVVVHADVLGNVNGTLVSNSMIRKCHLHRSIIGVYMVGATECVSACKTKIKKKLI